jgi:hypothetical protein
MRRAGDGRSLDLGRWHIRRRHCRSCPWFRGMGANSLLMNPAALDYSGVVNHVSGGNRFFPGLRGGPREAQNTCENVRYGAPGSTGAEVPALPGSPYFVLSNVFRASPGLPRSTGKRNYAGKVMNPLGVLELNTGFAGVPGGAIYTSQLGLSMSGPAEGTLKASQAWPKREEYAAACSVPLVSIRRKP